MSAGRSKARCRLSIRDRLHGLARRGPRRTARRGRACRVRLSAPGGGCGRPAALTRGCARLRQCRRPCRLRLELRRLGFAARGRRGGRACLSVRIFWPPRALSQGCCRRAARRAAWRCSQRLCRVRRAVRARQALVRGAPRCLRQVCRGRGGRRRGPSTAAAAGRQALLSVQGRERQAQPGRTGGARASFAGRVWRRRRRAARLRLRHACQQRPARGKLFPSGKSASFPNWKVHSRVPNRCQPATVECVASRQYMQNVCAITAAEHRGTLASALSGSASYAGRVVALDCTCCGTCRTPTPAARPALP